MGPGVGPTVGEDVGLKVGANVGLPVGPELGDSVGPHVGEFDGAFVGPLVGLLDGVSVGLPVGPRVGTCEGALVCGWADGVPVRLSNSSSCSKTSTAPRATLSPPKMPSIKQAGLFSPQISRTLRFADRGSITPGNGKSQVFSKFVSPWTVKRESEVSRTHHVWVQ